MTSYDSYLPTNVKWLPKIPSHWKTIPLRGVFNERKETNENKKIELILSLIKDIGVLPYLEKGNIGNKSKEDISQYKIARNNDLVLNKMNAVIGSLGVSNYTGLVSPIYLTLFIRDKKYYFIDFYSYVFQSKILQKSLSQYAYGIMKIRESIEFVEFKKLKLPFPTLNEQKAIALFLDKKCSNIENFISQKTKHITYLKELKTAIINECVTKGLDKTVTCKESGIEWLGKIPSHWEVKKLKFVAKCIFSNVDKHSHENEKGVLLCNYTDVYKNNTITKNIDFMKATATDDEIKKFLLQKNDIIITKDSEAPDDIAVPTFVAENFDNVLCGYHLAIIRSKEDLVGKFLYFLFMSKDFNIRFEIYSNGVTRYGLGNFIVNNSKIPIPPIREQKQIATHIEQKLDTIDKLIEKTTKEIDFVKEYKTSLIDEVVSGKRKVV